ncbi:MAG: molybdenum transporter, periplasmic molybdate-binding protein [Paenibacillaceae bacterium]|jgi:molybdate transport system substrate-binding protein|nr:molybdenum transporter, periplasmic molybdate-binding protein [Paenibacillaceae bacterium]
MLIENWKKLTIACAVSLAALTGLAGCGEKDEPAAAAASPSASAGAASVAPSPTKAPDPVELTISAAASLTESLNEIKTLYAKKAPHVTLTFNFGASGTLQTQIENGAPADLFLSAGKKQMDALVSKQLIDSATAKNLLLNDLVLVVPADSKLAIAKVEDLSKDEVKKLAVGTPESVPAGSYAKETLTYYKLWDSLQPKVVLTKDVKQVLSYVETGNTEAGFVYKTDAASSKNVKIILTADPASHAAIEYPIGVVKATKQPAAAKEFYDYLQTKEALDVFVKYGFTLPK